MTTADKRPPGMFKVAFDLERVSANWPPVAVERIWAKKTMTVGELALENIPFFVRDLACGDIIRVHPDNERRELVFDEVARHSGNSTVRVVLNDAEAKERVLDVFRKAGCEWEFNTASHFAVNIPSAVDYQQLRPDLVELRSSGAVGVEEAFIAERHRR